MNRAAASYVEETGFGFWFLRSHVWQHHVLRVAIDDLHKLISGPLPSDAVLLDAGCGQGKSFALLQRAFQPARIIGLDADPHSLDCSRAEADRLGLDVQLIASDCAAIQLPDASVDILFCHQTFHHLVEQEQALAEFWRVLKPGGLLLFAESTKYYIDTWVIRWLFRHPMEVQKSADEYLGMLRGQGFEFSERNVSYPYLWWSRSQDFGLLERWGIRRPKPFGQRNETLVNAAVRKPFGQAPA
ncbi:class I SAM-dependent methyltransferase [Phytopseudomonas dryadis]|uniref:SAM-dependent methyltransferase n=1 Tax=Phytopseudomonas dryadis TaxID=2487520 RepID=A0ABY1ZCS9_9GAMM|nr:MULTISPECIES: class I SAM-dependent methyltransferase [Pseudomonas]TBV08595.1 SAM-dependent methyltransferase [Pseudomonas dryadis]TBV18963.1 SAM-dependent methyltransferase [Pseudomonas sp. FRB 230]